MNISSRRRTKNRGVVLLVTMVFLLLLAVLSGTAIQTSILEFQMAANEKFQEEAFQRAQAIASAISSHKDNFPITTVVGSLICRAGDRAVACHEARLTLPDSTLAVVSPGVDVTYTVERKGPVLVPSLPIRMPQTSVSSSLAFDAAIFETQVKIDGGGVNLGVAEVVQGIALLVTSPTTQSAE